MSVKSKQQPIRATRIAGAKTIVMDRPPEMSLVGLPAQATPVQSAAPPLPRPQRPSLMITSVFQRAGKSAVAVPAALRHRPSKAPPVPRPPVPRPPVSRPPVSNPPVPNPVAPLARRPKMPPTIEIIGMAPLPQASQGAAPLPAPRPSSERLTVASPTASVGDRAPMSPAVPPLSNAARSSSPARTRMVDLSDALAGQELAPAKGMVTHMHLRPPPPPASAPPVRAAHGAPGFSFLGRRAAWAAFALLSVLALLVAQASLFDTSSEASASQELSQPSSPTEAPTATPTATPTAAPTAAPTDALAPTPTEAPADASSDKASETPSAIPTEAEAGAVLLSGRRTEALDMYRQLAQSTAPSEGIIAMISVLEQKVESP